MNEIAQGVLDDLMKRGKQRSFLMVSEVQQELEDAEAPAESFDSVFLALQEAKINIREEAEDTLAPEGIALRGTREGAATRLEGEKLLVPDAPIADLFAVVFRSGDAPDAISVAVVERPLVPACGRVVPQSDRHRFLMLSPPLGR